MEENPQDILDTLPPLPEEEEAELSPELKEGKDIYNYKHLFANILFLSLTFNVCYLLYERNKVISVVY